VRKVLVISLLLIVRLNGFGKVKQLSESKNGFEESTLIDIIQRLLYSSGNKIKAK
tara:strand:+ start:32879 stop:33043 length:165 start_codon:yes stop_codon:yes gene_type:complete